MHDIRTIRDAPAAFDAALARRGEEDWAEELIMLDGRRRDRIQEAEAALAERNRASKEVGAAKAAGDEAEFERLRALVAAKKQEIAEAEEAARVEESTLRAVLMTIPNTPDDDIPDGADETGNQEIRRWGDLPEIAAPKQHFELPAARGIDLEAAAALSGSRFMVLRGAMARLHRALAQFMLDLHIAEHGLEETWVPALVRTEAMEGSGQLPKFAEDSYRTGDHWLIPTSEVPLANLVAGKILDAAELPIRMVAHSACFRSEAGSAGRDVAGILRQHQFEKVEMISVTRPEDSRTELERMTRCAETVLERLGLPYRTMVLCAGDTGFAAARTHDIEVWLPGQGTYREISSCSDTRAFQARRMNARFRPAPEAKPEHVHLLNGSGLAVGRTLIAVLENGQQPDGSVALPEALAPNLGGATVLTAEGTLA